MDDKFTVRLGDKFEVVPPARLAYADITVVVSYRPWFLPWRREKEVRFYTKSRPDGFLDWLYAPLR